MYEKNHAHVIRATLCACIHIGNREGKSLGSSDFEARQNLFFLRFIRNFIRPLRCVHEGVGEYISSWVPVRINRILHKIWIYERAFLQKCVWKWVRNERNSRTYIANRDEYTEFWYINAMYIAYRPRNILRWNCEYILHC